MSPALLILVLFGLAFGVRWWVGWSDASPLSLPSDTALVVAGLLSIAGLRDSLHLPRRLHPRTLVWAAGVFATTHLMVLTWLGPVGRHGVFNLCLGGLHVVLAWHALQFRHASPVQSRLPIGLVLFAGAGLALLALVRTAGGLWALWVPALHALVVWVDVIYTVLGLGLVSVWLLAWMGWRYRARRTLVHNAPS